MKEMLKFEAYRYEVEIRPYSDGLWYAQIDGINHDFMDWHFYRDECDAAIKCLLWCRAHPNGTCVSCGRGFRECACDDVIPFETRSPGKVVCPQANGRSESNTGGDDGS